MTKTNNRIPLLICALLGGVVLVGVGVLVRPYWVAKYQGEDEVLRGALLPFAPLRGADLRFADLTGANLIHADLTSANLRDVTLTGAALSGADLTGADLAYGDLSGSILCGADLANALFYKTNLSCARYDARTRWPDGFDPQQHGAVKE
jgi:hypothetical protein